MTATPAIPDRLSYSPNHASIEDLVGITTMLLAILGLIGVLAPFMAAAATIVYGMALWIDAKALSTEFSRMLHLHAGKRSKLYWVNSSGPMSISLLGAGGIVLGILAILGINTAVLTPTATIAFGAAIVLRSNTYWQLHLLRSAEVSDTASYAHSFLVLDAACTQVFAGLAATVLGVLAVAGLTDDLTFNLVGLFILGSALTLTGAFITSTIHALSESYRYLQGRRSG